MESDRRFRTVLRDAASRIRESIGNAPAGSGETPYLDALVLLSEAARLPKEQLLANFDETVGPEARDAFEVLVRRRCSGEPVSYIRGRKEFYGRDFLIGPGVLVPRPDTETLVESALQAIDTILESQPRETSGGSHVRVHDCCTGSGCVAVTLACERNVIVSASDISAEALEYGRENARMHGCTVEFFEDDMLSAVPSSPRGLPQVITANPPYVADNEVDALADAGWPEPRLALAGGSDGLTVIKRLVAQATACLPAGGWLIVEIGSNQGGEAVALFEKLGFTQVELARDLAGRDRVCRGRWYSH